jgi:hypothetical protein
MFRQFCSASEDGCGIARIGCFVLITYSGRIEIRREAFVVVNAEGIEVGPSISRSCEVGADDDFYGQR